MVPPGLVFVLLTNLELIGLTCNLLASWGLMVVNLLMSWIDVHSSSIACVQWSCCGLSIASGYVNELVMMDVEARRFSTMISAFAEILTGLHVMRFVRGGWYDLWAWPPLSGVFHFRSRDVDCG
jgi:hypothetical protein